VVKRLWWKEARVFWPLWVALGLVAALVQWFLLWFELTEARAGLLIVLGPAWAMLYAFAVGAGIFAAETEANTQVFLDALPVGRKMLWTNKVLFALATTLGVALYMTALGALGTTGYDAKAYPLGALVLGHGVTLLEALAWSLLWSLVLGSALHAAVLGLLTVGVLSTLLTGGINWWDPAVLAPWVGPRLALAGAALLVSWIVYTRQPRPAHAGAVPAGMARTERRPQWQYGRLAWETVRESRRTWLLLAGAWVVTPLAERTVHTAGGGLGGLWLIFGILYILFAGVSVFAPANRTRSYRFLLHHGVRPRQVWATKLLVWSAVSAAPLAAAALVALFLGIARRDTLPDSKEVLAIIAVIGGAFGGAFAVAVLAGQVLRRSITAWVIAFLAFLVLVVPQLLLFEGKMIPARGLALFPALALAISWAWTGDWMNDLRGAVRWLRLGALAGAAAIVLIGSYISYRAWSVPDVGPPFPPRAAWPSRAPARPEDNAAADYVRSLEELRTLNAGGSLAGSQWRPDPSQVARIVAGIRLDNEPEPEVTWWRARGALVESVRRAAAKPEARSRYSDSLSLDPAPDLARLPSLLLLLGLDSAERRRDGDLAGAWDDLRAAFQMANQLQRGGGAAGRSALWYRTQALQWSLAWAGDRRQTPAQLRQAIADYRALPPPPPLTETLAADYYRFARILRHAPNTLIDEIGGPSTSPFLRALVLPWWEQERGLRVLRLAFTQERRRAELEPWQQTGEGADLERCRASTPVARTFPADSSGEFYENILLQRAFEQVVALRIWQLEHDGQYPEGLEWLVPNLLPGLPPDPYSGRPFGYVRSGGQSLLPLGLSGLCRTITGETSRAGPTQPGQWLLYSVGPNRLDNGAGHDYETNPAVSDLIFPLPPE
jgi:hypothetical protein